MSKRAQETSKQISHTGSFVQGGADVSFKRILSGGGGEPSTASTESTEMDDEQEAADDSDSEGDDDGGDVEKGVDAEGKVPSSPGEGESANGGSNANTPEKQKNPKRTSGFGRTSSEKNLDRGTATSSSPSADAMAGVKAGKKKKKGRYVDPFMEKVTTVRSKPVDYVLAEGPMDWPMPITSISEKDITELTASDSRVQKLQQSFLLRLSRIYPRGTRITSDNMLPLDAWRAGAHMVALNYQTNDLPVQINRAFFQRAAACGYILKPPSMRALPPAWPVPRQKMRCVTIKLLSLHQLPSRKEARPLYEPYHRFVDKLRDTSAPPVAVSVSSPALSVELFALGGYHCVATDLPPPQMPPHGSLPTRVHTAGVGGDGLHPHFDLTVHCLAAEPKETILRIGVQDLTYSSSVQEETDARAAHHSQDVAYEAAVLDGLRPGYRSLPLRSRSGCPVDMCCIYLHIAISEVEVPDLASPNYRNPMEA